MVLLWNIQIIFFFPQRDKLRISSQEEKFQLKYLSEIYVCILHYDDF